MQNITLKSFITDGTSVPASLVRSVVRQCGGWESFVSMAQDVCNCGASGGFGGFIYHTETIAFTKRNKKALLELCKRQAEEIYGKGYTIGQFIAGFNCVDCGAEHVAIALYTGKGDNVTTVYNALAWYALEEVCRTYVDFAYDRQ